MKYKFSKFLNESNNITVKEWNIMNKDFDPDITNIEEQYWGRRN